MRLVKLSCDCHINPTEIEEVSINRSSDTITVRMKNGIGHSVPCEYKTPISTTRDRLIAEIDEALK